MAFAEFEDVDLAYEGDIAAEAGARIQYLLDTVSARLRILLPDLTERIGSGLEVDEDLQLLAKDVVVQAVIRRMPGMNVQQLRSETQGMGPFSFTQSYTTDATGTFSDEDLAILRGGTALASTGRVGTIKLGRVDWSDQ